jgi:cytochrome c556
VYAETLAMTAQQIPAMFEKAAKNLEVEAEKLRDAAKAENEQLTQQIVKDFGRNACGTCHTPFRQPDPQQPRS